MIYTCMLRPFDDIGKERFIDIFKHPNSAGILGGAIKEG